jgi:hypothetical protein
MSTTKTIQITKKDFDTLEKVLFDYLLQNPNDQDTLTTMQSIIEQCLDPKP